MSTEPLPVVAYMRRGADADSGACHNLYFGCSDHSNFVNLTDHATATQRIADLERENAQLLKENLLIMHQVITCGVAASHSDANLSRTGAYAGKWDSPQAQQVRELRARAESAEAQRDAARDELALATRALESRERNFESACAEQDLLRAQRDALRQGALRVRALADSMNLYFTSGNRVPIDKAAIPAAVWRTLYSAIDAALSPVGAEPDTYSVDLAAASNSSGRWCRL